MKKIFLLTAFIFLFTAGYAQSSYPQTENTIRVMSYNIRNGIGMDNQVDFQRIAEIIIALAPDVVALQELDSVTNRSNGVDVLRHLASLTAMFPVYGAAIEFDGGKYGVGVLSRQRPLSWKNVPLPGREEARTLLMVEFEDFVLANTHFSLNEEDRLASVNIVNQVASGFDKPVILAGDLNALPDSPVLEAFREDWRILSNPRQFTFPADNPNRTIDYILGFTSSGYTYSVWQARVLDEPVASDHLPLFADIRLRTAKENIFRTPVYLQNPATDEMTVMWLTNVPAHSWVEFGTDTLNMQIAKTWVEGIALAGNTLNRIRLTGLQPGTRYYYRAFSREITLYEAYRKEFGKTASTEIRSFTTFCDNQTDFTAVIFNDLHDIFPLFDQLNQHVKNIPTDIVFFNGDCISDVQTEEAALRTISHFTRGIGGDSVPSIFVRGNHEARGAFSPFLWSLLGKVGVNHSYGAFSIGDTRFVVLDAGEDKPDDYWVYFGLNDFTQFRKDQADFLKEEIASEAFQSASRRVLIHHIPIYGWENRFAESFNPGREFWGDILAEAPFDIAINGHTHRFQYIPKGRFGNNFPVMIGGGNNEQTATVAILRKQGEEMTLTVLNTEGEVLLEVGL
jgi:endonuclease/exonuclease/phosphatase family metal-dependent hydrolase/predicted phosphodiesterase